MASLLAFLCPLVLLGGRFGSRFGPEAANFLRTLNFGQASENRCSRGFKVHGNGVPFSCFLCLFVVFLCARASLFEPFGPRWGRDGVLVDLTTILTSFWGAFGTSWGTLLDAGWALTSVVGPPRRQIALILGGLLLKCFFNVFLNHFG